jgi:hypothetical protein
MSLSNDGFLNALGDLYASSVKSGTVWLTSRKGACSVNLHPGARAFCRAPSLPHFCRALSAQPSLLALCDF